MAKKVLCLCLTLLTWLEVKSQAYDYYWRDYNGKIPEDALPGGKDVNGKDVYIGQIYVHDFGLFIGTIFQGKPEIEFSCYGIRKTDNTSVIKILCTKHKESFSWLPTTSKKLHTDTIDRHAVVGGYNSKEGGIYNIARTMHEGSIQIGPTNSFTPGTAYFFFVHNNKHHVNIENYEVLIFGNRNENFIIPRTKN